MFRNGDIIITSVVDECEYTIKLGEFPPSNLPKTFTSSNVPICDITLEVINKINKNISLSFLKSISYTLFNFLDTHNVIFYYYCDTSILQNRHCSNNKTSPQKYRRMLFKRIFERYIKKNTLIKKGFEIIDTHGVDHHIVLIGKKKHEALIDLLSSEIDPGLRK